MTSPVRVAVAMSGGVDSSVAAAMVVEQGAQAFGLMLRLWTFGPHLENRCCTPDDVARARHVAARIGIPFYVLDARDEFKQAVVNRFADDYAQGLTPNPCIQCNRSIRWGFLLQQALALGATHLATGHYARISRYNGLSRLLRGQDPKKDQSYVLAVLTQPQLAKTLFPLGDLNKNRVRAIAKKLDLPSADRPDSQDLCFTGNADYRQLLPLLSSQSPSPGPIVDLKGNHLGRHQSLAHFTIGQRKGIRIPGPSPLYVVAKDVSNNTLVVGPRESLGRSTFTAGQSNWVTGEPSQSTIEVTTCVRYKGSEVPAQVHPLPDNRVEVHLTRPLPDIAPGQWAAFYQGEQCLGGATIEP